MKATKQSSPLVSIVILNWHGTDDTLRCIESVKELDYKNIQLIVIDNEYDVDSYERLKNIDYPNYQYVNNVNNLGFTGGHIQGLQSCDGDYILLLNNDAIIDNNAVSEAIKVFTEDATIAAVGGRSYLLDDNGGKLGIFHYTHQRIDPISAESHTYTSDDGVTRDVSNVSGACVMIRRAAIESCGYLDNSFFAYYEETDLFARFIRNGWRVVFSPKVVIWHKMGASTRNKKFMYNYLMFKNQYYFAYKQFDSAYLKLFQKITRRHLRRSLMVYIKKMGRLGKDEMVYKARIHAFLNSMVNRPMLMRKRAQNIRSNFSINDYYFSNTPLPISIFIDASTITQKQTNTLIANIERLKGAPIKPAEIIVVAPHAITLPETESLLRYVTIVNNTADISALDYFFMTSNHDLMMFSSSELLNQKLTDKSLAEFQAYIKNLYITSVADESLCTVSDNSKSMITPGYLLSADYKIIALSKRALVNHLVDDSFIFSLSADTLTDVVGRVAAQCLTITKTRPSKFFGIKRGALSTAHDPILNKPVLWFFKFLLTKLHLWSISAKIIRKIRRRPLDSQAQQPREQPHLLSIDKKSLPIIFNTRDRFDPLMRMVEWLEKNGYRNLIFVDNDSSYPPLLEFFNTCPYHIVPLGRNGMHKAPWESMAVRFFAKDKAYIVSDPDIIPDEDCPQDAIEHFAKLLNKYPDRNKAGFGLRIDNLPDENNQKKDIQNWESRYWDKSIELEPGIYGADVDTTFALYRPLTWWFLSKSIRTGGEYTALHEPWYQSSSDPSDDFLFYKMRASREVSTWGMESLPKHHMRALKKEGFIDEIIDEED